VAAALEATRQVGTRLRTSMSVRRTLIHVPARPLVRTETVSVRARADEAARSITAAVRAGTTPVVARSALVDVRTAGAR